MAASAATGRIECIAVQGDAAMGKTRFIVEHARGLIDEGVKPSDIAVFSAGALSAAQMRERLLDAGVDVEVLTPMEAAVGLLATEKARAATGREPRILGPAEEEILLKDMEGIEGDVTRHREIIKFLQREWSELGDDKPGFLISYEEMQLNDGIRERLALRGGMLRHEAANIAVHYLRDHSEEVPVRPYVLVDDYQALCHASQALVEMMAGRQLAATFGENEASETLDPYPYPAGFKELLDRHRGEGLRVVELERSFLSQEVRRAASTFAHSAEGLGDCAAEGGGEEPCGALSLTHAEDTAAEVAWAVEQVRGRLAERGGESARCGAPLLVIAPDVACGREVERALAREGVPCSLSATPGDFWDAVPASARGAVGLSLSLLALRDDPEDATAWRTWIGADDALFNVAAWEEVCAAAREGGATIRETLCAMSADPERFKGISAHLDIAASRYDAAMAALEELDRFTSPEDALDALAAATGGEVDGRALGLYLEANGKGGGYRYPIPPKQKGAPLAEPTAVVVATPKAAGGFSAEDALLLRAVDGAYPSSRALDMGDSVNHRDYYRNLDEGLFYIALTRARGTLSLSYPLSDSCDKAASEGLRIARISARKGQRRAHFSPSSFLEKAGLLNEQTI